MKKIFLALIISVLLLLAFFLFKSCEPRQKTDENTLTEELSNEIVETTETPDYKNSFIEANIDFSCQIINGEIDPSDTENAKAALNSAYEKQGLPVDEDSTLIDLLETYKTNEEITATIRLRVQECQ